MVKRVVDIDDTYEIALGRRRAFGDEKHGRKGIILSKKMKTGWNLRGV
jgi:hypothetical protein